MDFGKLNDQQREIALKIADEARAAGVDPELALAVGWAENRFNATGRSPKGAIGPMQVMPSNARGLGIEPKDLLDPDKNIRAGVAILKENLDRFGNPSAALVGYNFDQRAARRFAETGDIGSLPQETRLYLEKVGQLTNLGTQSIFTPLAPPPPQEPVSQALQTQPELYQQVRGFLAGEGEIEPSEFAAAGSGAGALIGTGERIRDIFSKKTPEALSKVDTGDGTPGKKWARATGYGAGEGATVREQSQAYQRAAGQGKITKELSKRYGPGAPLDITRQAEQAALERELAERQAKSLKGRYKAFAEAAEGPARTLGRVPFGSVLAGGLAGKDVAEAMQRYEEGDVSGALINLVGGLGSAAALIPHPVTRIVGGGLSLASMPAEYINDLLKGKIKAERAPPAEYEAP